MERRGRRTPVEQIEPEPVIEDVQQPNPNVLVEALTMILDEAQDKENVKRSIKARLLAAATMGAPAPTNMSSMDADINDAIEPYEGDADVLGEVQEKMEQQLQGGARKQRKTRKLRKLKRKSRQPRKTRKYSRRR